MWVHPFIIKGFKSTISVFVLSYSCSFVLWTQYFWCHSSSTRNPCNRCKDVCCYLGISGSAMAHRNNDWVNSPQVHNGNIVEFNNFNMTQIAKTYKLKLSYWFVNSSLYVTVRDISLRSWFSVFAKFYYFT